MSERRPKPLTAKELQLIKEQWGQDRVLRKLLWEVSRLRDVVHRWYTYHWTIRNHRIAAKTQTYDPVEDYLHEDFKDLYNEPVIRERENHVPCTPSKPPPRWPHMSEADEAALIAKIEAGDTAAVREAKRHTRNAR